MSEVSAVVLCCACDVCFSKHSGE